MFRYFRFTLIFALFISAFAAPALADSPMTFTSIGVNFGVFAQGDITADTPKAFQDFIQSNVIVMRVVQFNSGGGDLLAALDLGRAIRRAGWSTGVGTPGSSDVDTNSGECYSACTFAFLGGVTRSIAPGSKYGVHRFWSDKGKLDDQVVQKIAGELVAYIREMGVSSDMYTLMTEAGHGDDEFVRYLDVPTMTKLRIMTTHVVTAAMDDDNGHAVLRLTDMDSGGAEIYGEMDFYCSGPDLLARASFGFAPELSNTSQVSIQWIFQPQNHKVAVPADAWSYFGVINGRPAVEIYVPPQLFGDAILTAQSIEVDVSRGTSALESGWDHIGNPENFSIPVIFRTLVQTVASSCH